MTFSTILHPLWYKKTWLTIFLLDVSYKINPPKNKKIKTVSYYRDKSKFKSEDFCDDVQSKFFAYIINMPDLDCDNVNDSFNGFVNLLRSIIENHAPLKRLFRRQLKLRSKPWLTKGIHISICNKHTMFRPLFLL